MDWDSLKVKTEALNNAVVAAAVGVGGIWAWYTFNGELKRENAAAQLAKLTHEIADLQASTPEVEVVGEPLSPLGNEYHVKVEVSVRNQGKAAMELKIHKESLRITPIVTPDLPRQPELAVKSAFVPQPLMTSLDGSRVGASSLALPAGGRNGLLYVAQVDAPGRYLVEFSTTKSTGVGGVVPNVELSASTLVDVPAQRTNTAEASLSKRKQWQKGPTPPQR